MMNTNNHSPDATTLAYITVADKLLVVRSLCAVRTRDTVEELTAIMQSYLSMLFDSSTGVLNENGSQYFTRILITVYAYYYSKSGTSYNTLIH